MRRVLLVLMGLYDPSTTRERTCVAAAVCVALALSGCGLDLPTTSSSLHNEIPTPPGPNERAPGARTPIEALSAFATTYINWDAGDVRAKLETLAKRSVGQARTAMQLEAAQVGADAELGQDGIANAGTVESVAPVNHVPNQYVVVTKETTTASDSTAYQGLGAAWHLTVATVRRDARGAWVVSGWQPQS